MMTTLRHLATRDRHRRARAGGFLPQSHTTSPSARPARGLRRGICEMGNRSSGRSEPPATATSLSSRTPMQEGKMNGKHSNGTTQRDARGQRRHLGGAAVLGGLAMLLTACSGTSSGASSGATSGSSSSSGSSGTSGGSSSTSSSGGVSSSSGASTGDGTCTSWRQTTMCTSTGPLEPKNDHACGVTIVSGSSGYCECSGGNVYTDCGHPALTCDAVCAAGS